MTFGEWLARCLAWLRALWPWARAEVEAEVTSAEDEPEAMPSWRDLDRALARRARGHWRLMVVKRLPDGTEIVVAPGDQKRRVYGRRGRTLRRIGKVARR